MAICGAYLMVAFADGRFDDSEESRLLSSLINDPALTFLDAKVLEKTYNELVAAFSAEYGAASELVLDAVKTAGGDQTIADAVAKASRLAVVADQRIVPQEEKILESLALTLGREPGSL